MWINELELELELEKLLSLCPLQYHGKSIEVERIFFEDFYEQKFQETEKLHVRKVKFLVRATERKMSVWRMETSDDSENVAACAATLSRFLVTAVTQVVLRDFGASGREAMRRLPASTFFEDIVSNKITTGLWNWRVVMTMNRCWFLVYKWFTRSWEYIPRLREREYVTLNVTRYKEPVPVSFSDFVSWGNAWQIFYNWSILHSCIVPQNGLKILS